MFLAQAGSDVCMVVRRADLTETMSNYLVERIEAHPRIKVKGGANVTAMAGEPTLQTITITRKSETITIPCTALFSFIGAEPNSGWLDGVNVDQHGFVLTDRAIDPSALGPDWSTLNRRPLPYETSRPGLFAVGDLRSGSTKRVAAAVGEGSAAIRSVHEHLSLAYESSKTLLRVVLPAGLLTARRTRADPRLPSASPRGRGVRRIHARPRRRWHVSRPASR